MDTSFRPHPRRRRSATASGITLTEPAADVTKVRAFAISAAVTVVLVLVWKGVPFGVQGHSALEAAVEQSYRVEHEQGRSAEPKRVWCLLSAFNPELVARSQELGADGPFDDCTVTFSDGTRVTTCWSEARGAYRAVWSPRPDETTDSEAGCDGLLFRPVAPSLPVAWGTADLSYP